MKAQLVKSLVVLAGLAVYSHAIFGIGGHFTTGLGSSLDGSTGYMEGSANNPNIALDQGTGSGLMGFGFKFWVDAIPVVDVEAAINFQFSEYATALELDAMGDGSPDTSIPLEIETGLPFKEKAKPLFGRVASDISIRYPFIELPPAVSILKLYVGAGVSHVLSVPILDADLAKEAIDDAGGIGTIDENATLTASEAIIDYFASETDLEGTIGGHVLVGATAKLPVIPIAVYIDGKYHIGGGLPDAVSPGFTVQLGGGLAF